MSTCIAETCIAETQSFFQNRLKSVVSTGE